MRITRRLAGSCAGTSCPTLYATDRGTLVVQGYVLTDDASRQLSLPPGEAAVEIPVELVRQVAQSSELR
jgi:hypothetical protein